MELGRTGTPTAARGPRSFPHRAGVGPSSPGDTAPQQEGPRVRSTAEAAGRGVRLRCLSSARGDSPTPARVRAARLKEEGRRKERLPAVSVRRWARPQREVPGQTWDPGEQGWRLGYSSGCPGTLPDVFLQLDFAARYPPRPRRDAPAPGASPPGTPSCAPGLSYHLRHFQQGRVGAGVHGVQQPLRGARARLPRAGPGSEHAAAAARGADKPGSRRHRAAAARRRPPRGAAADGLDKGRWCRAGGGGAGQDGAGPGSGGRQGRREGQQQGRGSGRRGRG